MEGGRRERARAKGEKKVFEEAKQKISLASFKATAARDLSDISQPMGLANLGLPHLQKGCFWCAFQVTETLKKNLMPYSKVIEDYYN